MEWPLTIVNARMVQHFSLVSTMTIIPAQEVEYLTHVTVPMVKSNITLHDVTLLSLNLIAGKSFKPENVVFDAVERFGIPNCGRNQVRLTN